MKKVVLITGVLGGIGSLLAQYFRENGYKIIGLDRKKGGLEFIDVFIELDLDKYCEDENYRLDKNEELEIYIPKLDVLINNAAVQILGSAGEIKMKDWKSTLNVNLTGPFFLIQFFLDKLEEAKGSIINISSIHSHLTKRRFVSYATSKSALVGLTKSLSVDFQGKVRVNSISPAAIDTQMLHDGFDNDFDKILHLNSLHPLQRIGKPIEVAKLAFSLADQGLGFINGADIQIDGGISNVLKDLD
jgi:NAD(P)-dependent dehydrogenase (short-subunit alcohol dehydrogenase family)